MSTPTSPSTVPTPLSVLTAQAQALAETDKPAAAALLHAALAGRDPAHADPDIALIDAATGYADLVPWLVEPTQRPVDLDWARYAYRASLHLHGHHHEQTLRAMHALADRLSAHRRPDEAVALRRTLVAARTDLDGPDAETTLAARMDLASLLHEQAQCDEALIVMAAAVDVLTRTREPLDGMLLLASANYAAMLLACGHASEANARLVQIETSLPYDTDAERKEIALLLLRRMLSDPGHLDVCTHRRTCDGAVYRPLPPPGLARWADLLP